jgi:hypothetical protein
MSGPVPYGAIVDPKTGVPTPEFAIFLDLLSEATGGAAYHIIVKRISDTVVHVRMKGADGVWRESADITLS